MKKGFALGVAALTAALVAGCGGGSTDGGSSGLQVSVTDAPVDDANAVFLKVTAIGVKPANGNEVLFTLAQPDRVNLLDFSGGRSHVVLSRRNLAPGRYEWLRLYVDDGAGDSFVRFNDGREEPIDVPSDRLHLNRGFTVGDGGITSLVVDFDLRKALVKPQGQNEYTLKPVLRLVRADEVGQVRGLVSGNLLAAAGCTGDLQTGAGNNIYAFAGRDGAPDDFDGDSGDAVVSTTLTPVGDGTYRYTLGYLIPGVYRIAFTCQGRGDHPDTDDAIVFSRVAEVDLSAGETETRNFE